MAASPKLSHLDERGAARMVDVAEKAPTRRRAVAEALVTIEKSTLALLREGAPKGDVIAVARIAGIQGAKRTSALIPLCHPLALSSVSVDPVIEEDPPAVRITCCADCTGPTGVEMEALTGASIAALAIYDMLKAVDRGMQTSLRLLEKDGGRSGHWTR